MRVWSLGLVVGWYAASGHLWAAIVGTLAVGLYEVWRDGAPENRR